LGHNLGKQVLCRREGLEHLDHRGESHDGNKYSALLYRDLRVTRAFPPTSGEESNGIS
jgi:hypothetical protein